MADTECINRGRNPKGTNVPFGESQNDVRRWKKNDELS